MKRIVSICLIVGLLLGSAFPVLADKLTDAQKEKSSIDKQLTDVQKKKQQAIKDRNQLQKDINWLESLESEESTVYQELMEEYRQSEAILNHISEELDNCEVSLSKQEETFENRLRTMYKNSSRSKINLLLNSKSLTEFFERIEYISVIARADKKTIESIKAVKGEVETKLDIQEALIFDLQAKVEEKKERINSLNISRAEKEKNFREKAAEVTKWEKLENNLLEESKKLAQQIKTLMSSKEYTGGTMKWPLPGYTRVGSGFGMRMHPILKYKRMHNGIDIGAPKGTNIVAANDGTVILAGWGDGYGNRIVIDHGGKISTLYAHCDKLLVKVGKAVKAGDIIAKVGSTGLSTGPHLHFEVRKNGEPVDPLKGYLSK